MSSKLRSTRLRAMAAGVGGVLLAGTLLWIATFPVSPAV